MNVIGELQGVVIQLYDGQKKSRQSRLVAGCRVNRGGNDNPSLAARGTTPLMESDHAATRMRSNSACRSTAWPRRLLQDRQTGSTSSGAEYLRWSYRVAGAPQSTHDRPSTGAMSPERSALRYMTIAVSRILLNASRRSVQQGKQYALPPRRLGAPHHLHGGFTLPCPVCARPSRCPRMSSGTASRFRRLRPWSGTGFSGART